MVRQCAPTVPPLVEQLQAHNQHTQTGVFLLQSNTGGKHFAWIGDSFPTPDGATDVAEFVKSAAVAALQDSGVSAVEVAVERSGEESEEFWEAFDEAS